MKITILTVLVLLITGHAVQAQNNERLLSDFALTNKAQYQLIDRETLQQSVEIAKSADQTGKLASQIPPFMEKLDYIEVLDLSESAAEEKLKFKDRYNEMSNGNEYETLIDEGDKEQRINVIAKKNEEMVSEIIIFVFDNSNENEGITVVKMAGQMDESDISDILKQQNIPIEEE